MTEEETYNKIRENAEKLIAVKEYEHDHDRELIIKDLALMVAKMQDMVSDYTRRISN